MIIVIFTIRIRLPVRSPTNFQTREKTNIAISNIYLNEYSYENIYNPTGNVFDAVDLVMEGRVKIAFELVPPPSHHSGYFWPIESLLGIWGGSCIVNNISIEVPYAKFKYQNEIKKIKMIDFDVHHGNRTEEMV